MQQVTPKFPLKDKSTDFGVFTYFAWLATDRDAIDSIEVHPFFSEEVLQFRSLRPLPVEN